MNKLFLLILLPLLTFGAPPEHTDELIIDLINRGSSWNVTITVTAIGARWDENYDLTGDYGTASDNVSNPALTAYFDHILASGNNPVYAVGIYKISATESGVEQAYFYMDWRTSDWSDPLDVYFKYDVGNNRFRNSGDTQTIDYTLQTLWDLTDNLLVTSGLEDYWDNALVMSNTEDDHPRIVWGPHPSFTATNYKVYRAMSEEPVNPLSLTYTLKATVSSSTYNYVDSDIVYGASPVVYVYYYVKGYNSNNSTYSARTNIVNTVGGNAPTKNGTPQEIKQITEFSISQNYPNPFNPSTKISYSLQEDSKVSIKIYDMLGTEVADLVNEIKTAGYYETTFDASHLSSGVYIYRIAALSDDRILFTQSKQMILLK